jgi:hypothetical protein
MNELQVTVHTLLTVSVLTTFPNCLKLFNGYGWGGGGKGGRGMKLTTHPHLVPKSRMTELYLHSHLCLHGIVIN